MKSFVSICKQAIILSLVLIPSPALALFGQGTDQSNVGTDWSNTDKNISTTGSITGDDITATGKITPSAEGILYNYGSDHAVATTIEGKMAYLVSDTDFSSLSTAIADIGAVTPTHLRVCSDNIIADGTTITATSNIFLDFTCGGSVQDVAGGGIESIVINGDYYCPIGRQCFGDDVSVTIGDKTRTLYVSSFPGDDIGDKINTTIAAGGDGKTIIVNGEDWFDQIYSTPIVIGGSTVHLVMPGIGDNTAAGKAHFTGTGAAITVTRSRSLISGGFAIDFTGNSNSDVDGIVETGSDSIISDYVNIADAPRYGVLIGSDSIAPYGNLFTGVVRITNPNSDGVRYQDLGGGKPNRNGFNNIVVTSTMDDFTTNSCTITQAAGVATVVETDHTYVVGDVAMVVGANEDFYNGPHVVRSTPTTDSWTFTIDSTADASATGTITSTKLRVGINYVDGYSNTNSGTAYVQMTATDAIPVASSEANPNNIVALSNETDSGPFADGGTLQINGGENFGADAIIINGGAIDIVDAAKNRPYYLQPYVIQPQRANGEYRSSTVYPSIYASDGTGTSEPFDEAGQLIIQSKVNSAGKIYFVVGGALTTDWAAAIDSYGLWIRTSKTGNGALVIEGAGSPAGVTTAPVGSIYMNSTGASAGEYLYYKTSTGTTGWYGIPRVVNQTYTPTNDGTDRSYDADSTSTDELADVLGTLITDLQTSGIIK